MSTQLANEHVVEHASEHLVQDLAADVEQAIWSLDRLRATDSRVYVTASADGAVTLAGHVRGDMLKYVAGRIAQAVPGVTSVANSLMADNEIEADLATALAMDPAQAFTDQTVLKSILGVVQLSGTISGPDQATADAARLQAQKLALATPGVRGVVNNLRAVVSGGPAQTASDAPLPAAGANDSAAKMQARLAVWRERVAR